MSVYVRPRPAGRRSTADLLDTSHLCDDNPAELRARVASLIDVIQQLQLIEVLDHLEQADNGRAQSTAAHPGRFLAQVDSAGARCSGWIVASVRRWDGRRRAAWGPWVHTPLRRR